jgi:chaperonin GroEL
LTRALFEEACKSVAAGCNPEDLRRGMQKATEIVADELKKLTKVVDSKEEIEQVATISANSDVEIGKLIAHAMEKIGKEGVILVQDGKGLDNEIEIVEGMKFDQGYLSHYFTSDKKTMKWVRSVLPFPYTSLESFCSW